MYRTKLSESPSMRRKAINTLISTLHHRNKEEKIHAQNVSSLCKRMGEVLSLSAIEIEDLKTVGLLHDIGKIAIKESLLNKTDELTPAEREEIKRHAEIGYRILSTVNNLSKMADYVLAHHERWDGTGYPNGIKNDTIPLQSRILHIAEAYDDMTSPRIFHTPLSKKEAIAELQKNAGLQFDPELIPIFIEKVLVTPVKG